MWKKVRDYWRRQERVIKMADERQRQAELELADVLERGVHVGPFSEMAKRIRAQHATSEPKGARS